VFFAAALSLLFLAFLTLEVNPARRRGRRLASVVFSETTHEKSPRYLSQHFLLVLDTTSYASRGQVVQANGGILNKSTVASSRHYF
jgi:hypothetical protein